MPTNQEIKWILIIVVAVCYAKAWLRKRWPDEMRTWHQLMELVILFTMLFLMVAALYNMTRPAAKPKPTGPSSVAVLMVEGTIAQQRRLT